jgi:hypothetical protein
MMEILSQRISRTRIGITILSGKRKNAPAKIKSTPRYANPLKKRIIPALSPKRKDRNVEISSQTNTRKTIILENTERNSIFPPKIERHCGSA